MYEMKFDWKEFSINLQDLEAWMKANAGEHYCGNSADSCLRLHFSEEPSQEIKDAVSEYMDGIDADSEEATSYKSSDEVAAEKAVMRTSAKAKLTALGFSEAEIAALVG